MSVERYLFFNSTFDDPRRYGALDMARYWRSFLSTGLIHTDEEPTLRVRANGEDMTVRFDDGLAVIFGHLYLKEGDLPFTLSPSSATEDRFDRIVLRYDNTRGKDDSRFIRSFLVEGTADGPPELTRTFVEKEPVIYEISLAQIHVKAGKSYLEQSDIIDERLDQELCGLASSLVTVPTDILTEEWREFVAEYNKWFADLQGSAFATVDDVRESENNMKREIANLNLQLEANKRVKNGVTFGTNFADSFGMEIDMARTSSDDALEIGQTVITVRDAEDFNTGTEVTIFDDANLERVNISSINGNDITLETALAKEYKEGANIARTMAIKESFTRTMSFGVWGTYSYSNVNDISTPSARYGDIYRKNGIIKMWGHWFLVADNVIYSSEGESGVWEEFKTFPVNSTYVNIVDNRKEMIVVWLHDENLYSERIDRTGTVLHSTEKADKYLRRIDGVDFDGYNLCISGIYFNDVKFHIWTLDSSGYTEIFSHRVNQTAWTYGLKSLSVIDGKAVGIYNVEEVDTTRYIKPVIKVFDIKTDTVLRTRTGAKNSSESFPYSGTDARMCCPITFKKIGGEYTAYTFIGLDNFKIITEDFDTFVIQKQKKRISNNRYIYWYGEEILAFSNNAVNKYLKNDTSELLETISPSVANYEVVPSFGDEVTNFFMHYVPNTNVTTGKLRGEGILGYGSEITTNDIRFKTKPSKEVVTWLQHDEGLTVTEATFGNINLDLSTLEDETQAVGYTTKEQNEVRLTIERPSIDDDVKTTRILGGTN